MLIYARTGINTVIFANRRQQHSVSPNIFSRKELSPKKGKPGVKPIIFGGNESLPVQGVLLQAWGRNRAPASPNQIPCSASITGFLW